MRIPHARSETLFLMMNVPLGPVLTDNVHLCMHIFSMKCRFRISLIYAIVCLAVQAFGQQWPQYAHSTFSMVEINPATAGVDGLLSFTGATRRQWNNLPGSPTGYHLSAQSPIPFLSSGVGFSLMQDQIGLQQQIEFTGIYSYHLYIGRQTILGIGLAGGLMQSVFDGEGIRTPGGIYGPSGPGVHNDNQLPAGSVSGIAPLLHGGVVLQGPRYSLGSSLRYGQGGRLRLRGEDNEAGIAIRPHVLAHAQYRFGSNSLTWLPALHLRTDGLQWQGEGQVFLSWRDRFMLGGGVRGWQEHNLDAWILSAGVRFSERFLLLYSFEGGLSALQRAHNGTFELSLRYDVDIFAGRAILPPRIYNPRFL
jgi:type IX secretion system PorP/SprF family membrane protein